MRLLAIVTNPAILGTAALFLSVVWMLRDEKDKTRPMLVFALTMNLFFGFMLTFFMGREGGLLPWKYDHVLAAMDASLGVQAAPIARFLEGAWRGPLILVYQLMVPMMICWFFVTRRGNPRGSVVLAYVGAMIGGPLLYAILPACGPIYAFGRSWLNPPAVEAGVMKLAGMPNAFPSLHIGTAMVFVLLAPGRVWRAVAVAFLSLTALATIATGEHYVIDLFAGLVFGCFAASVGYRKWRAAAAYFGAVLGLTLTVRLDYTQLVAHPLLVRLIAVLSVALALQAVYAEWRVERAGVPLAAVATS
jgi:hypothetical protein